MHMQLPMMKCKAKINFYKLNNKKGSILINHGTGKTIIFTTEDVL